MQASVEQGAVGVAGGQAIMDITAASGVSGDNSHAMQPAQSSGWEAELRLRYASRSGASRIVERTRRGPLAVQRPFYPEGEVCHTYLLHPPGGVVGGDSLDIRVQVETGAQALITTPGATKFYRSGGRLATQVQRLEVAAGGSLEWLPQENIFFPDAKAQVRTLIDVQSGGCFVGWDIQCLGRPVIDEAFDLGSVLGATEVRIDGKLILVDQLRTEGRALLDAAAGLRGYPMQATLVIVPPTTPADAEAWLAPIRARIEQCPDDVQAGATHLDGITLVRVLGRRTEPMLRLLSGIWAEIRPQLLRREACAPRIWAT